MAESLVVVSKVKKMVKEAGLRTGGDYLDALSARVNQLVSASVEKVKADASKKTLGAEDLV
jgi:hypothetical protein